jgi:hypothetical protein
VGLIDVYVFMEKTGVRDELMDGDAWHLSACDLGLLISNVFFLIHFCSFDVDDCVGDDGWF